MAQLIQYLETTQTLSHCSIFGRISAIPAPGGRPIDVSHPRQAFLVTHVTTPLQSLVQLLRHSGLPLSYPYDYTTQAGTVQMMTGDRREVSSSDPPSFDLENGSNRQPVLGHGFCYFFRGWCCIKLHQMS